MGWIRAGVLSCLVVSAVTAVAAEPAAKAVKIKPDASVIAPIRLFPDLVATRAYLAEYVPPALLTHYTPISGQVAYGQRVYLVCEIANQGPGNVAGTWKLGYFVDGVQVYAQTFGAMPAGRHQNPAGWYLANADGAHTYECKVDFTNAVKERSETNNSAKTTFTVKPWTLDLAVTLKGQETGMWCWAAGTEMALEYLGATIEQCQEANHRFGRSDCCTIQRCPNPVSSGPCVQGGWPELDAWGFSGSETAWGTALTFQQLTTELAANRPVLFSWGWTGGGGHLMTARGVMRAQGVQWVHINDPWAPCQGNTRWITYAEWVARAGDHTHWRDYYNLKKKPAAGVEPAVYAYLDDGQGGVFGDIRPASVAPGAARSAEAAGVPDDAEATPPVHPTPAAAAAATLRALTEDEAGARSVGLAPGEAPAQSAPIREAVVRLDELKAYAAGSDPGKLLRDSGAVLVPVVVGAKVRSGVTVTKVAGGYQTAGFGDEVLAPAAAAQLPDSRAPGAAAERLMVRIPALKLYFVARREAGTLMLVPVLDDARFELKAGAAVEAAKLFEQLAPAAREVKPDVPA